MMEARLFYFLVFYATTMVFATCLATHMPQYLFEYVGAETNEKCLPGNHSLKLNSTIDQEQELILPRDQESVFFKAMGLWRISQHRGWYFDTILAGIGDTCQPLRPLSGQRLTATRFGDPFQILKEIHLYDNYNFYGVQYKAIGSTPSVFPPITVRSYHFTGNYSWKLFSGRNYTGKSVCRKPKVQGRDWGITHNEAFEGLVVRSVRQGC
ncbi:uncharacterized protein LOC110850193 [Folsomia candida]|uniref:uncharacterized protein LOC110850193 n=1 Tax=Folsomia candida TaxID=158441 RepID=UPI001604B1EF|nr:uncharacterized protein LOC110850193 [Folsomia candida]